MAIQNLPNYVWVNKGKPDPLTGQIAHTRYAVNLLTGDRLNVRQVQTAQHGGVPYEKRAPAPAPAAPAPGQPAPAAPVRKEYKLRERSPQFNADLRDYLNNKAKEGIELTERQARQSDEWKQINRWLRAKSNKPTGVKSKALILLGRRAAEWDWNIGETPDEDEGEAA